ncbi:MAG: iron chelate uptake ABC transporter family permease subunit, partial [Pseudomonadota bacterium]
LLLLVLVLFAASTALGRWLDLIALGPEIASGRGLNLRLSQPLLFLLAGLLVALATAAMGLAPFIGLLAAHIARRLGAGTARFHLALSAVIGAVLLVTSDWIGRTVFYPVQIPAGLTAAVIGGLYFVAVLRARSSAN